MDENIMKKKRKRMRMEINSSSSYSSLFYKEEFEEEE